MHVYKLGTFVVAMATYISGHGSILNERDTVQRVLTQRVPHTSAGAVAHAFHPILSHKHLHEP